MSSGRNADNIFDCLHRRFSSYWPEMKPNERHFCLELLQDVLQMMSARQRTFIECCDIEEAPDSDWKLLSLYALSRESKLSFDDSSNWSESGTAKDSATDVNSRTKLVLEAKNSIVSLSGNIEPTVGIACEESSGQSQLNEVIHDGKDSHLQCPSNVKVQESLPLTIGTDLPAYVPGEIERCDGLSSENEGTSQSQLTVKESPTFQLLGHGGVQSYPDSYTHAVLPKTSAGTVPVSLRTASTGSTIAPSTTPSSAAILPADIASKDATSTRSEYTDSRKLYPPTGVMNCPKRCTAWPFCECVPSAPSPTPPDIHERIHCAAEESEQGVANLTGQIEYMHLTGNKHAAKTRSSTATKVGVGLSNIGDNLKKTDIYQENEMRERSKRSEGKQRQGLQLARKPAGLIRSTRSVSTDSLSQSARATSYQSLLGTRRAVSKVNLKHRSRPSRSREHHAPLKSLFSRMRPKKASIIRSVEKKDGRFGSSGEKQRGSLGNCKRAEAHSSADICNARLGSVGFNMADNLPEEEDITKN